MKATAARSAWSISKINLIFFKYFYLKLLNQLGDVESVHDLLSQSAVEILGLSPALAQYSHYEVLLCRLVINQRGPQLSNEDEERDHGEDDHGQAVDQLAGVSPEVEGVEPQVDGVFGHHILTGRLPAVLKRPGGFDQLVRRGKFVRIIDLLVDDVPPLPQHRLLVRLHHGTF